MEEKHYKQQDSAKEGCDVPTTAVVILNEASASWDNTTEKHQKICQISRLTFSCEQGSLIAVIGPVGAGKTSLLLHLADEMPHATGITIKRGQISYSAQDPWIVQDTVRENILFGQTHISTRYTEVLQVCGLNEDISRMPDGDMTLIGERGLTLSGGQKARVSLARAVYRDADIYLLDDPLSAVDTKVGRHIFESCIKTFLTGKMRILVTHQIQYLPDVDTIIMLNKGKVSFVGSFATISESKETLQTSLLTKELQSTNDQSPTSTKPALAERLDEREEGDVAWSVYWGFIKAGGVLPLLAIVVLYFATQSLQLSAGWFLSEWTNLVDPSLNSTASSEDEERLMFTVIGLTVTATVFGTVVAVPFWIYLALSAKRLHNCMFSRVMRAPTRFFDINPVGIVLNRFSRDMGFVDFLLPDYCVNLFLHFTQVVGSVLVVCVVLPWLFLLVAVLTPVMYALYRFSVRALRDLKRLEATARSPLYSHVSETLAGLQTIRILKMESTFVSRFNSFQDDNSMRWLMFLTAFRWLALMASLATLIFLTLVIIMTLHLRGEFSAAFLGFCMTNSLIILEPFECLLRLTARIENAMTAVERILNYNHLEEEAAPYSEYRPPDTWPSEGNIQLKNVSLYYYEGALPALQDVSVNIRSGQKIGVVGRTGSGKSSLLQCLMRLTEPRGQLYIDEVDITKIGLQDLRSKISVIPQDPVLFSGSIRMNLDPVDCPTDDTLWDVLRKVQLAGKVGSMFGGLDAEVQAGGSNLSIGEKQLVCLARALLKSNRILILDEATANIDKETDRFIQAIIRLHFHDCTVLIIAHRLDTIMDCNKVMVLDQGRLVEYDAPYTLLNNPGGFLYNYAQQTGSEHSKALLEIAEEAHVNRLMKN